MRQRRAFNKKSCHQPSPINNQLKAWACRQWASRRTSRWWKSWWRRSRASYNLKIKRYWSCRIKWRNWLKWIWSWTQITRWWGLSMTICSIQSTRSKRGARIWPKRISAWRTRSSNWGSREAMRSIYQGSFNKKLLLLQIWRLWLHQVIKSEWGLDRIQEVLNKCP